MITKRDISSGVWIKKYRNVLGISQKRLGELIGVHENTIINWEQNGFPTRGVTKKWAQQEIMDLLKRESNAKLLPEVREHKKGVSNI